mmetsp:Transcript_23019/g.62380  ORF Transcript_23019/g.62380 Transcript_23019/m.62380 type:complete len:185 (+) Transcript_23019:38-592(+)
MEWNYEMRRQMQEILPSLFLGPYGAAKDLTALREQGVTHILIVRSTLERRLEAKHPDVFRYHVVEVPEGPTENLILFFTECNDCIRQVVQSGGKILVHCNAGLSRSAAVVVAYVMESMRMPYADAIQFVQQKRCCIHISEPLLNQLREFEAIYQNRQAAPFRAGWDGRKRQLEEAVAAEAMATE